MAACAVNPVTGKNELALISESQELAIGKKQYGPSRQGQGGDYIADPDLVGYVKQVGQRLAKVSDRQLPYEFVIINSSVPNAWALPGGKIAVNRGLLLELKSEAELAAVLGHEIVHAAARHSARGIERGVLMQGAVLATGMAVKGTSYAQYSDLAIKGAGFAANLVNHKYGRDAERESDQYGMLYMERAGYDPKAAIELQKTFVRLNNSRSSNWLAGLFASHPPSQERVDNNTIYAATLRQGGELGVEKYKKAMAKLTKVRGAYDAYDEGVQALKDNKFAEAQALAKKAIKIEPNEGLFHALLGDALAGTGSKKAALTSYNRAIKANSNFFDFFEKRGMLRSEMGDVAEARTDMERGAELFPTANSYLALGRFAEQDGDHKRAISYFRDAAQSQSDSGRLAARSLVKLDLANNPNSYLKSHFVLDRAGNLLVSVKNLTPIRVHRVRVAMFFRDQQGQGRRLPVAFATILEPGKAYTKSTGIAGMNGQLLRQGGYQLKVVQAAVY